MNLKDFDFELPRELIAQYPCEDRTTCRMLVLDGNSGAISHKHFFDILDYVSPGDLMVFNDTKVIPARIFGSKESGGAVEALIERIVSDEEVLAHVRSSRSPKPGTKLIFGDYEATVRGRSDDLFILDFSVNCKSVADILDEIGHIPLPPYIERPDEADDQEKYQTVYSREPGAVAAPTAGLHFDDALLQKIRERGIRTAFLTLHVGAGTFKPVKVENIKEHHMHSEFAKLGDEVADLINDTHVKGGRVIAVGTTSVRTIETAAQHSDNPSTELKPFSGFTDIFIYPGYQFLAVDALITNFHLPESTLLMLVSAFAGYKNAMSAYKTAVEEKYRFFSYGDAMFITRNASPDAI